MHKIFGKKENVEYIDRKGIYIIPINGDSVGIVQTPKGYFLLGGGLKNDESDELCIERECKEEVGYTVSINNKIGSAEAYYKHPVIGHFHPIQTYYLGMLLEKKHIPIENDHKLEWVSFDDIKGKMHVEMQNWAIEEALKNLNLYL